MHVANIAVFQPELRIKKVSFQNFRGFEHLEVELRPELTVFIGENGAGKTTVLDGIAKLLLVFEKKLRSKRVDLRGVFKALEIKQEAFETTNTLCLSLADQELNWTTTFTQQSYKKPQVNNYEPLSQFRDSINLDLRSRRPVNLPVVVYYPAINAPVNLIDFEGDKSPLPINIFDAYEGALEKKSFDFIGFFNWYKWQENIEKQLGNNPVLNLVREAIYMILSDNHTQFDKLSINWINSPTGEMLIEKNGTALNINQLSSGEKTLLALVADLARRLAIANPQRDNPLLGYGVVLIDELDLHLHPRWQRNVIPKLRATFPNCQLIVTTHSPQVLSQVQRENVVILDNFRVLTNTPHTFGRDSNSILFELMGVKQRPEEMQARIDKCYDLIDNDKLEEAEAGFQKLAEELGPNDPDIVHGVSTIHFMKA